MGASVSGEACVRSVVSNSFSRHGLQPASLLCPWNFPGKNTEYNVCVCVCVCDKLLQLWVAISCSRDLPDPGIEPASLESPALAGRIFYCWTIWETSMSQGPWHLGKKEIGKMLQNQLTSRSLVTFTEDNSGSHCSHDKDQISQDPRQSGPCLPIISFYFLPPLP